MTTGCNTRRAAVAPGQGDATTCADFRGARIIIGRAGGVIGLIDALTRWAARIDRAIDAVIALPIAAGRIGVRAAIIPRNAFAIAPASGRGRRRLAGIGSRAAAFLGAGGGVFARVAGPIAAAGSNRLTCAVFLRVAYFVRARRAVVVAPAVVGRLRAPQACIAVTDCAMHAVFAKAVQRRVHAAERFIANVRRTGYVVVEAAVSMSQVPGHLRGGDPTGLIPSVGFQMANLHPRGSRLWILDGIRQGRAQDFGSCHCS